MTHSITPWVVDEEIDDVASEKVGYPLRPIYSPDGFICYVPTDDESEANAQFIVRACNHHDELVGACEAALAYPADPPSKFAANRAAAAEIIRAAIAKVQP